MGQPDCDFCSPNVDDHALVENATCVGLWDRTLTPLVVPALIVGLRST